MNISQNSVIILNPISGGGNKADRLGINSLIKFIVDNPDKKFVVVTDNMERVARDFRIYFQLITQIGIAGAKIEYVDPTNSLVKTKSNYYLYCRKSTE